MVCRTKERALDPLYYLGACATRPGHAVNMLTEERLCKRHPGAASMQLHGTALASRKKFTTELYGSQ